MLIIITTTFNLSELIDSIYEKIMIKTSSPQQKIKIEIKFYNEEGVTLKPYFYFITRNFKPKYRLYNYIRGSYINFIEKNKIQNIGKYEIIVTFS
jgi:hypothetical protein